jgi:hypothetical protein
MTRLLVILLSLGVLGTVTGCYIEPGPYAPPTPYPGGMQPNPYQPPQPSPYDIIRSQTEEQYWRQRMEQERAQQMQQQMQQQQLQQQQLQQQQLEQQRMQDPRFGR